MTWPCMSALNLKIATWKFQNVYSSPPLDSAVFSSLAVVHHERQWFLSPRQEPSYKVKIERGRGASTVEQQEEEAI